MREIFGVTGVDANCLNWKHTKENFKGRKTLKQIDRVRRRDRARLIEREREREREEDFVNKFISFHVSATFMKKTNLINH